MRTNAPNKTLWIIAVVLGAIGILGGVGVIPTPYSFWLVTIAFLLLAVATIAKGL